jgi:hypothetical protein
MNRNVKLLVELFFLLAAFFTACQPASQLVNHIRPTSEYPGYWEYRGNPILLIGGTDTDNLFQKPFVITQLHDLATAGGNYIRNTMSARESDDVQPFLKLENGLYELNQWNPEYWHKLDTILQTNTFTL